jgi:hypothetical protein
MREEGREQMPDFDGVDTQSDEQQYDDQYTQDQDQDTADQGQGDDEDFLVVNERTRYKTREEALAGFQSAGKTIASLSPWGKLAKELGVSPEQAAAIIREHSAKNSNQNGQQASGNAGNGQGQQQTPQTHSIDESQLTKEEKDALQWIKKVAPALGFVPKTEIESLKTDLLKQIEELKGFKTSTEEQTRNSLIETGRSELGSLLTAAKLSTEPKFVSFIENGIKAWIEADEERVERFYQGGEETKKLIREAFEEVKSVMGLARVQQKADATRTKTSVPGRPNNARPNPAQQQRRPQQQQPPQNQGGPRAPRVDPMAKTHDRAWAAFQRVTGGSDE